MEDYQKGEDKIMEYDDISDRSFGELYSILIETKLHPNIKLQEKKRRVEFLEKLIKKKGGGVYGG